MLWEEALIIMSTLGLMSGSYTCVLAETKQ